MHLFLTGRPGPVLIDVPKDVQQKEASMIFPDEFKIRGYHPWTDPDIMHVERAIDMLLSAERPIILAGGGTIISSAFAELQSVAELLMIPVVTTFKVAIPVRMFVAPGPDVAKHTPGFLLTRPNPSAICAADCSCRTKICLISHLANSSYIGRFAPPGKPNTSFTPSFSIATISALAPIIVSILFNQIYLHNFNVLKF